MDAQVVYEREEKFDMQCGAYGYERVGIRIDERVIWLAICHDQSSSKEFKRWDEIAHRIVDALKKEPP